MDGSKSLLLADGTSPSELSYRPMLLHNRRIWPSSFFWAGRAELTIDCSLTAIVDRRAAGLEDYRYLHATRGELLRRLGRTGAARDAYRRALTLADDDAERRLLQRRLDELSTAAVDCGPFTGS